MITKVEYTNQTDRQIIIDANTDKYLIEDAIYGTTTKEYFLIFADIKPIEQEIVELKEEIITANGAIDFIMFNY